MASTPYLSLKSPVNDHTRSVANFKQMTNSLNAGKSRRPEVYDTLSPLMKMNPLFSCGHKGCRDAPQHIGMCGKHCALHCCALSGVCHDAASLKRAGMRVSLTGKCQHAEGCSAKTADGCALYCRAHCCNRAVERTRASFNKRMEREKKREKRDTGRRERGM